MSKSKKKSSRQEEAEEEDFFADMAPDIKKREGREEIELDKEEKTPEKEKVEEDKGPTIAPSRYKTFSFTKSYGSSFGNFARFAVAEAMAKAEEAEAAETAEGGGWGDWGGDDDDGIVF